MTQTQAMLDTFPGTFGFEAGRLAEALEALADCATTCTQCADACLAEDDAGALARCIRRNLDCADVCNATSRVVARQAEYDANVTRQVLEACVAACRSCGDECAGHAEHMEHCRICSEQCRRCEQACRGLLDAMS